MCMLVVLQTPAARVPGWTGHVKPLKEKSLFWTDCGRPRSGTVAECMR